MRATTLLALLAMAICVAPVSAAMVIDTNEVEKEIVVEVKTDGDSGTWVLKDGAQHGRLRLLDVRDGADGDALSFSFASNRNIEPGGAWIGIAFGPVPKPLASHLRLEGSEAQMVLNVAKDSPADQAGFKQYDVIVNIDGKEVPAEISGFLDIVRGFEPGEDHNFSIIRGGTPTQATVTVGTRPDLTEMAYKYEQEDEANSSLGQVFQRGGLMRKGDDGNWTFDRFDALKDLPNVWHAMPHFGHDDMTFAWRGGFPGNKDQFTYKNEQGLSIEIKKDDDGRITVTKTEKNGDNEETSTSTYENEDEFKQSDPDTFKHYGHGFGDFRWFDLNNNQGFGPKAGLFLRRHGDGNAFEFDLDVDSGAIADALKELKDRHKDLDIDIDKLVKDALKDGRSHAFALVDRAKTSFDVDADGQIRVTTTSGGQQLTETYRNAEQLRESRPELYDKYKKLKSAGR